MSSKAVALASVVGAVVCGLAAVNVAALTWLGGTGAALEHKSAISQDTTEASDPAPVVVVSDYTTLPAASHVQQIAEGGLTDLGGVTVESTASWPTWCSLPSPDAVVKRTVTTVTGTATWTLHVAATAAGQGAQWWEDMLSSSCPNVAGAATVQLTSLQPSLSYMSEETKVIQVSVNGDALRAAVWRQGDVAFFLIRTVNVDDTGERLARQDSRNSTAVDDSSVGDSIVGAEGDGNVNLLDTSFDRDDIQQVQAQVSALAERTLTGVCVDRTMGRNLSDQGRNPYLPGYQGLRVPVLVPAPSTPAGLTVPQTPQLPTPQWSLPAQAAAAPVQELAPLVAGAPGDDPDVNLAQRGPAPLLLDPSSLGPAPAAVTYPQPPLPPTLDRVVPQPVTVPVIDVFGPGCGWDFTGMEPPVEDSRLLEEERSAAVASYTLALAQAQTQWLQDLYNFDTQVQTWLPAAQAWVDYQAYVTAVESVQQQWNSARDAYNQSVDLWRESITVVPDVTEDDTTVSPAPEIDPNPGGETPVEPTPSPSPSSAPDSAQVQDGEGLGEGAQRR